AVLPAEVLVQDNGTATVQVKGVAAGKTYYVRVASGSGLTGAYRLAGDFRSAAVALPTLAAGTLTVAQPAVVTPLDVSQCSVAHFVLSSDDTTTSPDTVLTVT